MAGLPVATVVDPGDALMLKSGAIAVSVTVAVCVSDPAVPVMVIVELPGGVALVVVMVRVEVPDVVTDAGANVAVAPVGRPEAARLTAPVKPLRAPIVTV